MRQAATAFVEKGPHLRINESWTPGRQAYILMEWEPAEGLEPGHSVESLPTPFSA